MDDIGVRVAFIEDPDGYVVELVEELSAGRRPTGRIPLERLLLGDVGRGGLRDRWLRADDLDEESGRDGDERPEKPRCPVADRIGSEPKAGGATSAPLVMSWPPAGAAHLVRALTSVAMTE